MSRQPPFRLVRDDLPKEGLQAVDQIRELFRRGEAIGIAFAVMLRERKYFVNAAGEAHRNPTFARGIVAELDDYLHERVRGLRND